MSSRLEIYTYLKNMNKAERHITDQETIWKLTVVYKVSDLRVNKVLFHN